MGTDDAIHLAGSAAIGMADALAFLWFALAWVGYAQIANRVGDRSKNLVSLMSEYRLAWMRQLMRRDNRITDMTAIGNLMRNIAFFASTSILVQLGLFTMLGYRREAIQILHNIPYAGHFSPFLWQIKVFLLMMIFVYAFFKFTWSLRQYNYICVFISATPMSGEMGEEERETRARRGCKLLTNAARHFNLGMRAYYYGLAVFAWFLHPWLFALATTLVVWVLYRREFFSHLYAILSEQESASTSKPSLNFRKP